MKLNFILYLIKQVRHGAEKLDYNYELEGYEGFTFVTEKSGDFWVFSKFPAWW